MIIKTEREFKAVFTSSICINRRWTRSYFSAFAISLSGAGVACLLFANWKRRDRGFRWQLATSFVLHRGVAAFSPCKRAVSPSRLFARISESGFSKGTKESGARPIEPPSLPPQEVINFKHSSPAAGSSQPVGIKRRDSSNFHQYRFIFSLAWWYERYINKKQVYDLALQM